MKTGNRIAEMFDHLFKPNPHRQHFEDLRYVGIDQAAALKIIEELTTNPWQAEPNLAAAIALAKAGIEGHMIPTAVSLCRTILDRELIAHAMFATTHQMVETAEMVAAVGALTGNYMLTPSVARYVLRWKESVL